MSNFGVLVQEGTNEDGDALYKIVDEGYENARDCRQALKSGLAENDVTYEIVSFRETVRFSVRNVTKAKLEERDKYGDE